MKTESTFSIHVSWGALSLVLIFVGSWIVFGFGAACLIGGIGALAALAIRIVWATLR